MKRRCMSMIAFFLSMTVLVSCGSESLFSTNTGSTNNDLRTSTVPSAPTGVTAAAGNGEVTISWDNVSGTTAYNIYWSTISGVTKDTGTKISNVTSPYIHTGLTNGTTYYYVIMAVNSIGESSETKYQQYRNYGSLLILEQVLLLQ